MHEPKAIPQGSVSHGQFFAATGILLALGMIVPLAGVIMIPGAVVVTLARALGESANEVGFFKRLRAP